MSGPYRHHDPAGTHFQLIERNDDVLVPIPAKPPTDRWPAIVVYSGVVGTLPALAALGRVLAL
jgi:hypothetical protein